MVPSSDPVMSPEQMISPVVFTIVHPVARYPPASSTSPSEVFPICTFPVVPASRVRLVVAPVEMAPVPAKVRESASTAMVSMEETEVSAPLFITIPFMVFVEVGAVIAPATFKVPATTVFPVAESTVNLSVLTAKSPMTSSVPPTVALLVTESPIPDAVKEVAPEKVLASVPDWVYAPEVVMPVTPDSAPLFIINPFMVSVVVRAAMVPFASTEKFVPFMTVVPVPRPRVSVPVPLA